MSLLKKDFKLETGLRSDGNIQSLFLNNENYEIVYINSENLKIIENQPFKLQSDEYIEKLAFDIKENGLYSPLLVRKNDDFFEILSGRHRFLAFKFLKTKEIPCIVTKKDDEKAIVTLINANLNQRHNLKKSELAFSYKIKKDLIKNSSNVWEELAKDTPYSEKTIRRLVKITELNEFFIEKVDEGLLKQDIYLELTKLSKDAQNILCEFLIYYEISFSKLKKAFISSLIEIEKEKTLTLEIISDEFTKDRTKPKNNSTEIESEKTKTEKFKAEELLNLYEEFGLDENKWNSIIEKLIEMKVFKKGIFD